MDRERMPQSTSHSMFKCFYVSRRVTMYFFFFFNDTATTEIYTLSLHDALPISVRCERLCRETVDQHAAAGDSSEANRSEEHTSELQSPCNLVCRLLLEKKKKARDPLIQETVGQDLDAALALTCSMIHSFPLLKY